jgi:uncharacterized protein YbjT (DUF2867 family)
MTSSEKARVLVVGVTGMLGGKIVDALLERGETQVRALVRDLSKRRGELAHFERRGVELVDGDVLDVESLDIATRDVRTVVSAVNNQPQLIIDGQTNLLRASERNGVQRFFPSDFSVDYRKVSLGDNDNLDMRLRFYEVLMKSPIEHTLVLNGAFSEMLMEPAFGSYNPESGEFRFWGDPDQPMDFTLTDDAARYVAASVTDPRVANQSLNVAGDVKSNRELAGIYETVTGQKLELKQLGTADQLKEWIARKKPTARNPWEYLPQQYQWTMVTGKGKLDPVMNDLYPEIKPVRIQEFLQSAMKAA